jgi:hypothetical protein
VPSSHEAAPVNVLHPADADTRSDSKEMVTDEQHRGHEGDGRTPGSPRHREPPPQGTSANVAIVVTPLRGNAANEPHILPGRVIVSWFTDFGVRAVRGVEVHP